MATLRRHIHGKYVMVYRGRGDRILEHRFVMQEHLGRKLLVTEVVHHINENTKDNRIVNLQIMSATEHALHHLSSRRKTLVWILCKQCRLMFQTDSRYVRRRWKQHKVPFCSKRCSGKYHNSNRIPRSSNGRKGGFEPPNVGSTPTLGA